MPIVHRAVLRAAEDRWVPSLASENGMTANEVYWSRNNVTAPSDMMPEPVLTPVVNHGRWLVDCPWCAAAALAARGDPRFYCASCHNGGSGRWVPVDWPADADQIEELLGARPDERSRNMVRGETVDELRGENAAHGVV